MHKNIKTYISLTGTGNVLKIQSLLHTCSEFYKSKDKEGSEQTQEEGAGSSEATPTSAKTGEGVPASGGEDSGKPADKPSDKPAEASTEKTAASTPSEKEKSKKSSSKDVEMKDAEQSEPGAIGEPGSHQAVCVLGIALIAMGEDIGAEMALRTFNHLVSGGEGKWREGGGRERGGK